MSPLVSINFHSFDPDDRQAERRFSFLVYGCFSVQNDVRMGTSRAYMVKAICLNSGEEANEFI